MSIDLTVAEENFTRIYTPVDGKVMHTLVFASGSGTNFEQGVLESREPESNFDIGLLVTDKERSRGKRIGALTLAQQFSIDAITLDGFKACGNWKEAQKSEKGRAEYQIKMKVFNELLLEKIHAYEREHGFTFDIAVLAGYMRWVKDPLLAYFRNRMINVHPARLDVFREGEPYQRRFVGGNAVNDALCTGETSTRSSVIMVADGEDSGAVLASGPWVLYTGKLPVTQERADQHQDKQKRESDHPTLRFVLRAIARGEIGLHRTLTYPDGNPLVVYKNQLQGYQGVDLAQRS